MKNKETETAHKRDTQEKLADCFYNISKIAFAAVLLAAFAPQFIGKEIDWRIVGGGLAFTILSAFVAHRIMKSI